LTEERELEKLPAHDQREMTFPKQELRRKEKALAEAAGLLIAAYRSRPSGERTGTTDAPGRSPECPRDPR
jgi:hypothetical protein